MYENNRCSFWGPFYTHQYSRGAQIPGDSIHWQVIFVVCHYATSFMSIFRWREICRAIYIYVKFAYFWFNFYGIELKVNVVIIIRLRLLIDIYFLYPIENNTFTVSINLLSTRCLAFWIGKIKYNRNNTNGKLYWNKYLPIMAIYCYIYF